MEVLLGEHRRVASRRLDLPLIVRVRCPRLKEFPHVTITLRGVIRGRTVELKEDPGVADGLQVEITIKTTAKLEPRGEGLRRCAGAFAADWTEDDDRLLQEIHQDRKRDTRKEISG
jgi:hypothetical protein